MVLDLSAVGAESPSFLTSSRCVYVCAPFLVFPISRLFPDIIVSPCRLVDRRLTLLDSVEPTFFRQNPLFTIGAIGLSRATYRKMVQNLLWATVYNVLAIPVAAGVFIRWRLDLPMSLGAMAMSLSTIIVALNAQFLRRLNLVNLGH